MATPPTGPWRLEWVCVAGRLVAAYKDIRPVVQQGRLFRVASVLDGPFGANEYVAADGAHVVVLGWWGPHQLGAIPPRLRLAGLKAGARYRELGTGEEHWGAALMQQRIALPGGAGGDYGSTLIRLARIAP
jgi:alpha-galactosidase